MILVAWSRKVIIGKTGIFPSSLNFNSHLSVIFFHLCGVLGVTGNIAKTVLNVLKSD